MKVGIIREGKVPADKRVPLTPGQCREVQQKFPHVKITVQPSKIRCFPDSDYTDLGIDLSDDLSDCSILLGVKEVPVSDLIEGKTYFFFSHTIKKQAYNRKLLQTILKKKIRLVDYEVLIDRHGFRIIGFGRFAGLVGAYNGLRALGLREKIFDLKPAHRCRDLTEMLEILNNTTLPPVKIAITGDGRVAGGVIEIFSHMGLEKLSPSEYLASSHPTRAVYTQLLPGDYTQRKDGSSFDLIHFFNHPEMYRNAFIPYARETDMLVTAAYWNPESPVLFTANDMRNKDFRISVISDITCDIEGSVPSTKRPSTIDDPFYDYNPATGELELPFSNKSNITVQAVDNLPCELPKDASESFGKTLSDKVFPALFNDDIDGIIERASITKEGRLTEKFAYLKDFVE